MRLKELRNKTGLTQTKTAENLGIPRINYNKYETTSTQPDIETLCKIADYFNVTLDYLCEHTTNKVGDFGTLTSEQITAVKILLSLPQQKFYEYLGRLKTTADLLNIKY